VEGEIASGDRFFAGRAELNELKQALPMATCVEMEGAAVAQVCHEYGIRLAVIRTISDAANENAPVDFPRFVRHVASAFSHGILKNLLTTIGGDASPLHQPAGSPLPVQTSIAVAPRTRLPG
jgi:adenosylhomocysteine nucleosidase